MHYFDNAAKALGIVFMKFEEEKIMKETLSEINNHFRIKLCGGYNRLTVYTAKPSFISMNGGVAA